MRWRRWAGPLAALVLAAAAIVGLRHWADPVHRFAGLEGPAAATPLPAVPAPADPDSYARGGTARLAIYLTDPQAPWLALAHGLRTIGVPFVVTRDAGEAVRHRVVLAYPTISGRRVAPEASRALRAHVAAGGTLVGFEVLGAGLQDVFGLQSATPGRSRRSFAWSADAPWGFGEPEERLLPLASAETPLATYALEPADAEVLARYDDGSAALLRRAHGRGVAYTLGFDLGAFVGSAQNGRRVAWREYVNAYEPPVDVFLRWLQALYRAGEPRAVTLGTVPQSRPLALVLTHDVDYNRSIRNAVDYARSEQAQGVRATFFVQTKYVRDWNDDAFFDEEGAALTRQLFALGGELASHSVAHSPVFAKVPVGTGGERYPGYAPHVESKTQTEGASVLGELRVSRFLLQATEPRAPVDSFRPGHLQNPPSLPQALQAAGYRNSSTLTAGLALSHLPFRLTWNRDGRAPVPVFEFPITLEDELVRPMDTVLLPRALETARKLAHYGGLCVVLIHPNVLEDKLRFQEKLVAAMQARGAWIGTLGDYAAWWAARDGVEVDVEPAGERLRVRLNAPAAVTGLPVQWPAGWRLAAGEVAARAGAHGWSLDLPAGRTELLERAP